jgi:hypothetical protein
MPNRKVEVPDSVGRELLKVKRFTQVPDDVLEVSSLNHEELVAKTEILMINVQDMLEELQKKDEALEEARQTIQSLQENMSLSPVSAEEVAAAAEQEAEVPSLTETVTID